jgi:hypothetical protein
MAIAHALASNAHRMLAGRDRHGLQRKIAFNAR